MEEVGAIARDAPRKPRRVGMIVPSVNTVIEPDFARLGLPGLSFHVSRVMLHATTPEGLREMNAGVARAAELIASVSPDVVAFACTSGSFIDGEAALARQIAEIGQIVGCPVVATSRCIVESLRTLRIRRVALATPYLDTVNEAERCFLQSHGFEVVGIEGMGLSGKAIREVDPDIIAALVHRANRAEAEAIFVSCTDFRALEIAGRLEDELGKPVLTSNQVTLRGIFDALGLDLSVDGCGSLLA